MDSIIIFEALIVPLYYDEAVRFTHKNVQDLGITPIDMLNLRVVREIDL